MSLITQETAETVAIGALAWLAQDDELLTMFLGASGASADDLRTRVNDTEFLVSVLDFILMNDDWVTAFCDFAGHAYDVPIRARATLPGGADVNWT